MICMTEERKQLLVEKEVEVKAAKAALDEKLQSFGNLVHDSFPVSKDERQSRQEPWSSPLQAPSVATAMAAAPMRMRTSGHRLDHGVLLVGYGVAGFLPIRLKEKSYGIIKNSWGDSRGDQGYYKICRGHNVYGVYSMVSTMAAIHTSH